MTRFGQAEYVVRHVKGTMVTAIDATGRELTRDRTWFKKKSEPRRDESGRVDWPEWHILKATEEGEDGRGDESDGDRDNGRNAVDTEHSEAVGEESKVRTDQAETQPRRSTRATKGVEPDRLNYERPGSSRH